MFSDFIEEVVSEIDDCAAVGNAVAAEDLAGMLEYLSQAARLRGKAITARHTGYICEALRYEAQSEEAMEKARAGEKENDEDDEDEDDEDDEDEDDEGMECTP